MAAFASRYARAFAQVANASQLDPTAAQQQMNDFQATLDGSRELREVLANPAIAIEQKVKVLDALTPRLGLSPQVRNFIAVVMSHQRLGEFREIVAEYHSLADDQAGVVEAVIASARPLNDQDRAELEGQVARMAGGRVRTTYVEDPSLLGGAVVKVGSTVYDGSLKAQLADMKQKLVSAQIT